jgi:hypothetical protein
MASLAVCAMVATPSRAGVTKTIISGDIIWEDDFLRPGGGEFLDNLRNYEYCVLGTEPRPDYTGSDPIDPAKTTSITIANGQMGVNHDTYLSYFGPAQAPFAVLGWQNSIANCTGGSPLNEHDAEFDNDDICLYAGMRFNAWHLKFSPDTGPWGPDALPGYGGVDDDGDGTTDYNKGRNGNPPFTVVGGNDGDFPDGATPDEMAVSGTYDGTIGTAQEFPFVEGYDVRVNVAGPYPNNGIDDDSNGTTDDEVPWQAFVRRVSDSAIVVPSQTFTSGVPVAVDRGLSITFTDNFGLGGTQMVVDANNGEWDYDLWVDQLLLTSAVPSMVQELYGWNQKFNSGNAGFVDPHGPDGKAGVAGVDDDGNGVTDEFPTIGRPGTDDDADGTTDESDEVVLDELGERNNGDDADDELGRGAQSFWLNANIGALSGILINVDPGSGGGNIFSIRDFITLSESSVEGSDEAGSNFYVAEQDYGFVWCVSNSCYGAQMWIGDDVANPAETLGPVIRTGHNGPDAHEVVVGASQFGSGVVAILERWPLRTNEIYDDKFWVIEGDHSPTVTPPQDRDKDGDVDGVDFAIFASCFNKAGNPPRTLGCTTADGEAFDTDNDGDVDGVDFAVFASCFNKAGNTPRAPGCYPVVSSLTACGS